MLAPFSNTQSLCFNGSQSITQYLKDHDIDADACVEQLRKRIFEVTKLTASAGIAPNMVRHSYLVCFKSLTTLCFIVDASQGMHHH